MEHFLKKPSEIYSFSLSENAFKNKPRMTRQKIWVNDDTAISR